MGVCHPPPAQAPTSARIPQTYRGYKQGILGPHYTYTIRIDALSLSECIELIPTYYLVIMCVAPDGGVCIL